MGPSMALAIERRSIAWGGEEHHFECSEKSKSIYRVVSVEGYAWEHGADTVRKETIDQKIHEEFEF